MNKFSNSLMIIGYSLSLLYVTKFFYQLFYMVNLPGTPFFPHAGVLMVIFLVLLVSSFGVVHLQEWARWTLLTGNFVLAVYYLYLINFFVDFVNPAFLLSNVMVILYFNLPTVKLQFLQSWSIVRKSILVVDDDQGLLKTIQKILLSNGYSVLAAPNGEKGIQIAKLQQPDLIILDVILPGLKGREVCQRLKEDRETKDIPVIFLTAKDSPDDIQAELAAGAVTHITKPVHGKTLLKEIKRVFDQMEKADR